MPESSSRSASAQKAWPYAARRTENQRGRPYPRGGTFDQSIFVVVLIADRANHGSRGILSGDAGETISQVPSVVFTQVENVGVIIPFEVGVGGDPHPPFSWTQSRPLQLQSQDLDCWLGED